MEDVKISEAINEIKSATEDELKDLIEKWFENTRTDGMHLGAYFVSAAVYGAIEKNLKNGLNSSHRDYQRAINRVIEIVTVQLKQPETRQNDLEKMMEEQI